MPRCSPLTITPLGSRSRVPAWTPYPLNLPIPNNAALLATQFYTQGYLLDPPANALDAVSSDAAAGIIGR